MISNYNNVKFLMHIFSIIFSFVSFSFSQSQVLDSYIATALQNNLSLKQKNFELEQSILELNAARGNFFPSVNIIARYSRAGGGRIIDFPIGDIINPIHQGLNILNPNFGYPANLPNLSIPFLRTEEHETKFNIVQPIIQPALFYNYSIKSNVVNIKNLEKDIYRRQIISEVKITYFNYLKLLKIQDLLKSTLKLVDENLKINKSLYENDKVTVDAIYRSEADIYDINQKLIQNENDISLTKNYLNFLLNRSTDSAIEVNDIDSVNYTLQPLEYYEHNARENREELILLNYSKEINKDKVGINVAKYFPSLFFSFDYGFQGEKYKFSPKDDFWMASLVLNWNLFNGFKDKINIENAMLESDKIELSIKELINQLQLQVKEKYNLCISNLENIKTSNQKYLAYKKSYNIIMKKYLEGIVSQIEFLDAQNKLIQSEVEKSISLYNYSISYSELEKVSATYNLNSQ